MIKTSKQNIIILFGLVTLSLIEQANCGWNWGWCPSPALQSGFDLSQYTGVWFEQKRDKSILYEYGECVQAGYSSNPDGTITVHNSLVNPYTNRVDDVVGSAVCEGPQCKVGFFIFRNGDYRVVSTDYTTYSVVYSCSNKWFIFSYDTTWILTRAQAPSAGTMDTANNVVSTSLPAYSTDNFHNTVQGGNCLYMQ